ncbi:hypothetical protein D9M68_483710 [compost metagenome]
MRRALAATTDGRQLVAEPFVVGREAGFFGGAAAQHHLDLHAAAGFGHAQAERLRRLRRVVERGHAVRAQQVGQREFVGRMHPAREFGGVRAPAHGFERGGNVGLADRAAVAVRPEVAHHVVERALAFLAQCEVEAQRHQRALGVVADGAVGRLLVLAVVLDPGVEARVGHRLHEPAGRLQHLVDGLVEQPQVGGVVDAAGAAQQQVVVVAREAFEEPQQLRVVLLAVVVARELGRAHALDVPGVEVLVADEAQQRGVALGLLLLFAAQRQVAAVADERGGVAVLEPAVAVVHRVEHEHVAVDRQLRPAALAGLVAVPEADLGFADGLGVGNEAIAVERGRGARDHEAVRHAAGLELGAPEGAHLDRAVGQFVVAGGAVAAEAVLVGLRRHERGGARPARGVGRQRGRHDLQRMRRLGLALDTQADAGAVEEAARGVEPGGAHRVVVGAHLVVQHQRLARHAVDLPAAFVELRQHRLAAALRGAQALQVLGELAHEVAAWDPHRQRHALLRGGRGDGQRDGEQARMQVGALDAAMHGGRGGGCGRAPGSGGRRHRISWRR